MDFFKEKFSSEILQKGQIFLIDKPLGWTSFQVVNKIRWHLKKTTRLQKLKVGHAGTLDPLASGLIILCTGKKTKTINEIQGEEKTYTGTFNLGASTPSYDLETEIDQRYDTLHITESMIKKTASYFRGEINQIPPLFSAIKKDGKRLYKYARSGKILKIHARKVWISKFEIHRIDLPEVDFLVQCGKGTYIRSLVHDFGKKLQSGAYLSYLKRTNIGGHSLGDAYSMKSVLDEHSEKNIKSVKID